MEERVMASFEVLSREQIRKNAVQPIDFFQEGDDESQFERALKNAGCLCGCGLTPVMNTHLIMAKTPDGDEGFFQAGHTNTFKLELLPKKRDAWLRILGIKEKEILLAHS